MKCPNCQSENLSGAKFCSECGRRLITSGNPQSTIPFQKDAQSGYDLPKVLPGKIPYQREMLDGELRYVTIMFCDMKGFTPLSAEIGPERTFFLMDQVFAIIIRRVNEHQGIVNELRGDGALVFFGAPIAVEEAAIKALHCALAIQKEIAEFNTTISAEKDIPPIAFRIGINSGPAVIGVVGKDLGAQYTAQGDTVNVAARMEAIARPGTIYVTEETYRITGSMFHFEDLGNIRVKGKKKPVHVYRLSSQKVGRYQPRLGDERTLYSKMVDREAELARLEFQVMQAITGRGSIVNVVGEAGIGKSRLLAELKEKDVMKRVTLLEGRATSIERRSSFHPFIGLIREWAGIAQEDSGAAAAYKLETLVKTTCGDDLNEILPFISILMGAKLYGDHEKMTKNIDGRDLRNLIFRSVRVLFGRAAEITPLILAIEDLHWADASTIDLLSAIFRLVEDKKLLFLNLFRPGYSDATSRIVQRMQEFPKSSVEIELKPLDKRDSEIMVQNLLPLFGLHHPVLNQIVRQAGGNPLFIEEVARSIVDEGAVVREKDNYWVTRKMATFSVPSTITDILMFRIDHLDERSKEILKLASVIGMTFSLRLLLDVIDNPEDIDPYLTILEQRQLLLRQTWTGDGQCIFRNALTRKVLYETILTEKRKEMHRRVAQSIEKVFKDRITDFYGMLAYHYSKAGDPDKAEEYLTKAGEEALRSFGLGDAFQYYEEALNVYMEIHGDDLDKQKIAAFERNIAISLYDRGHLAECLEHFEKALRPYWGSMPSNRITAIPKLTSAVFHLLIGLYLPVFKFRKMPTQEDLDQIDLFQKKCKALGVIDPIRFLFNFLYLNKRVTKFDIRKYKLGLEVFMVTSSLFSFSGVSFRLSRKILNTAKDKFNDNDLSLSTTHDFLETLHNYCSGDWKNISPYNEDLVNKNLRLGKTWDASQHIYWHGLLKIYQGDFHQASLLVDRLKGIALDYDNDFSLMLMYELNINMLLECRKLREALLEIEKAMVLAQEAIFHIYLFDLYSYKAWINILMEDMTEAEICIHKMYDIRRATSAVPIELISFYRTGMEFWLRRLEKSIQNGDKRTSSQCKKAFEVSQRKMARVSKKAAQHRTELGKLTGKYYWLIEKQDKALIWWRKAISEGKLLGNRLELSRAYFEIGKSLLESKSKYKMLDGITAEKYLEQAKNMFEEMGLNWDLAPYGKMAVQ